MHSIYTTFLEKFQQFEFEEEKMSLVVRTLSLGWALMMIMSITNVADGAIPDDIKGTIDTINNNGPYLGVVVPNRGVMNPLLQSSNFLPNEEIPHLDYAGRRFRIGTLENRNVIVVMSGTSILNSGLATQLLLSIFKVEGVVHFGLAGSGNPKLHIGDVTIPHKWAHTGLWHWERFGDGPESIGHYTKTYGRLRFADYQLRNCTDNLLNKVWYQPEDIYLADGEPENRQRVFWVPVAERYFLLANNLKDIDLERCVNPTTCLPRTPKVVTVRRGVSANVFVDNAAYREFSRYRFGATPIDMESAGVALVCHAQRTPFIAIRAISNLPGTTSSHESSTFSSLAVQNAVRVVVKFISLLSEKVITLDEAE